MSDLLKSLSSASVAAVLAGTGGSAVPSALASAASLPSALANLTAGNVIAGVVIERGRAGLVVLKTDKGLLQLQTALPLKVGANVVLEVQSVGAQLRFAILSVDDHAPSAVALPEPAPEQTTPTAVPNAGNGRPMRAPVAGPAPRGPLVGLVVTAEVVEAAAPAPQPKGADLIPALLGRIAAIAALAEPEEPSVPAALVRLDVPTTEAGEPPNAPPPPNGAPSPSPAPQPSGPPEAAVGPSPAVRPPSGETTPVSADSPVTTRTPQQVTIRILAVLPQAPARAAPSATRAHVAIAGDSITLLGTVAPPDRTPSDRMEDGLKIATPIGTLRLLVARVLPPGAQITFEVLVPPSAGGDPAAVDAAPPDALAAPPRTMFVEPPRTWPELGALLAAAEGGGSGPAIPVPRPGPELAPAILLFLAAARGGGTLRAWLGQVAADALDAAGHGTLIDRLGKAFGAEQTTASAIEADGWQMVSVPIAEGQRLSELRFHFQRRRKANDGRDGDGGSRFVIEATLSALGPLQLDGRVRSDRFDLLVRTARALSEPMRRDIARLFADSLADTDIAGGVSFRADMASAAAQRTGPSRGSDVVV